jgi:hypothetical protein
MSNPSALGTICWEPESAWGEDVTTFTKRLSVLEAVDPSGLMQSKQDSTRVEQYRQGGSQWVKGVYGGTFKTKIWLAGHGSTMVGSPAIDDYETFLGIVLGNVALSAAASTTTTGGTATVPTTTASGTFSAGGLCRIGSLADGKGNGQFYAIATHTTTSLTLLGDTVTAPVTTNVLYPVVQVYPSSSPTNVAITGTRFLIQTANLQYECHGCFPTSISYTGLNTGEMPAVEITWQVSWWRNSTATFPSAVTANTYNPAPVAAGSFNVQVVGTTTRNPRVMRNFTLDYTLGIVPLKAPGGVNAFQEITGAVRTPDSIKLSWTEDADAATLTPVLAGYGTATNSFHIEYTLSTTDGSAVGFKWPKVCVTNVPTQMNDGGINRLKIEAMAYTGGTTTSALTLAAQVLGLA